MKLKNLLVLATAGGALTLPIAAHAQDVGEQFQRDHNISVLQRKHPEYDPLGIRAGGFIVDPSLTETLGYDTNVFATQANVKDDEFASFIGDIHAQSDWNRHSLTLDAKVDTNRYDTYGGENTTNYDLNADGQLDVTRNAAFIGSLRDADLTEDRTDLGAPLSDRPIRYHLDDDSIGGAQAFNRFKLSFLYRFRDWDYKNGTRNGAPLVQSFRDRTQDDVIVDGYYAVSPDTAIFLEGRYDNRNYRNQQVFQLNSDGYEFTAGADFDLNRLARGRVQLGYLEHSFDNPAVPNLSGLGGHLQVDFFPTDLITVTLYSDRDVFDSGSAQSPGVIGLDSGVQADYELLRNFILVGKITNEDDSFRGIDRHDNRVGVSLGATYKFNRKLGVNLAYAWLHLNSSGAAARPDYDDSRVMLSLVGTY